MKKKRNTIRVGIGTSSIMMIFVVLCMMILSMLSYSKALQKEHIALRGQKVQQQYTTADATMQFVIHELSDISLNQKDRLLLKDHDIQYQYRDEKLILTLVVDEHQQLYVVLVKQDDKMKIETYEIKEKGV